MKHNLFWVYVERSGPTPIHLAPGRETEQRRGYWASAWETRSAHPYKQQNSRAYGSAVLCFKLFAQVEGWLPVVPQKAKHVLVDQIGTLLLHPMAGVWDVVQRQLGDVTLQVVV